MTNDYDRDLVIMGISLLLGFFFGVGVMIFIMVVK